MLISFPKVALVVPHITVAALSHADIVVLRSGKTDCLHCSAEISLCTGCAYAACRPKSSGLKAS